MICNVSDMKNYVWVWAEEEDAAYQQIIMVMRNMATAGIVMKNSNNKMSNNHSDTWNFLDIS